MSIFPTKVLLATDGSKEADLAARTAAELADKTGSELHLVHVFGHPSGRLSAGASGSPARSRWKPSGNLGCRCVVPTPYTTLPEGF